MSDIAYIDSSCLVAIALGEAGAKAVAARLDDFATVISHPLLDAEVRSACSRERVAVPHEELTRIELIEARRAISDEIDKVLSTGYVRGADCLHLATALYVSPTPSDLTFLTLDTRQRAVAKKLGFKL